MLGFTPVEHAAGPMRDPNAALEKYRAWNDRLDAFVWLEAQDPADIVAWRVGSERARRDRGETALSDEDAHDYILRFLPAYELYVPGLPRQRWPALHVILGTDRAPR